jgi:hypothetical protein
MKFAARIARVSRVYLRVGVLLALFGVVQAARPALAADASLSATLMWAALQGHDIVASYSRDRDGVGQLRFREAQGRRNLNITYLVESNKDLVANLGFAGMHQFNGLFVVSLESTTSVVVEVFIYDDRLDTVVEVANTAGRWLPELMYVGEQADPAVGVLRQTANSKGPQPAMICGEKVFMLNQRTRRIEESAIRWNGRGGRENVARLDASCTD